MTTILVPVDFSDCSYEVVRHAARVAKGLGARLRLLHVLELPPGLQRETMVSPNGEGSEMTVWEFARSDAACHMSRYESIGEVEGVDLVTDIVAGQPADAIVEAGELGDVEQIVMGTHGRSGFARMLTGSVAEMVVRRSSRPVTLIRSQHEPTCDARSCAWCRSGTLEAQRRLWAELDG
ncbi:MAG: hypothetical protein CSA66_07910 [Proteobacteria bacterium]|nr:MAG: hypothetical protein CSA66_07910 [Pseudomonadota bacterium]